MLSRLGLRDPLSQSVAFHNFSEHLNRRDKAPTDSEMIDERLAE